MPVNSSYGALTHGDFSSGVYWFRLRCRLIPVYVDYTEKIRCPQTSDFYLFFY